MLILRGAPALSAFRHGKLLEQLTSKVPAVTGLYAVASWRRGGQTLGMRAWKIRVVDAHGRPASTKALWRRFAWGGLSLLPAGAGFWWSLLDRQRLTWHDRASGTRLVRLPPP